MGKGIWGIDVSKYSIKVVRLEGTGNSVSLTHVGVFPYEGTGTGEQQDMDAQVKATLAQVKATYGIREPVAFSLASHSTFNRLIKLPPVDDAKIPEIVKYEAQSQIPFNIDEVIWDFQYVERVYAPGEEKEVILFAIKRDVVEQFLGNISDLAFNVEAVQFAPVALFNFLVKDQDLGGPCVALDMGGDNTDLIVVDGTKFWVRNLPITGNDITKALQKSFNIPFEEAEKLKLKAGQSQQAQKIFNAIQPVLRDLVNEINRSMGYYKSISKTSKFEKILLLGNSTKTLNFQKFISQSLQLNAARVQKLNTITVGGQVDPGDLNENLATLGTALGLALQGLGLVTNKVNLLPPVFLQKKELKKKQPFILATVAALYALVGLVWYQQSGAVERLQTTLNRTEKAIRDVDSKEAELGEARKVADIENELKPLVAISSERDLVLKIMNEINPNVPDNGDWAMKPEEKLWVVDWKFDEKEKPKEAPPPGTPGAPPAAPAHQMGGPRPYPTQKILTCTIEAVVTKRNLDAQGRDFVIRQLLNYNPANRQPVRPGGGCVVKNQYWELGDGQGPQGFWRVEFDQSSKEGLPWPVPRQFQAGKAPPDTENKRYWRYLVTIEMPVGEKNRKAQAAPKGSSNGATEKK
jgi:type IV pilus assembly protein PilM